ncbi:MAG: hypothetical protein UMR38_00445 [Candidatus Izemoplasma sp.]|nr:hypothetical protein [Candidatus Izemoplasma sp.]
MLLMYLCDRYLSKKSDYQFEQLYEKWFIQRIRTLWLSGFITLILGTVIITEILMLGTDSIFLTLIVYTGVLLFYGGAFIMRGLRFYAKQNQRYMFIKMGGHYESFSKDNVVN